MKHDIPKSFQDELREFQEAKLKFWSEVVRALHISDILERFANWLEGRTS